MMALDLSTDRPWWKEPMVWLIAGLPATAARPITLRGEERGPRLAITDRKLTFPLGAYAPASFVLQP